VPGKSLSFVTSLSFENILYLANTKLVRFSVEVVIPTGQVTTLNIAGARQSVAISLASAMTVNVAGADNAVSITSSSSVAMTVKGATNKMQVSASSVTFDAISGANNNLEAKSNAVTITSLSGASNTILVEGTLAITNLGGAGNNVKVNGGSCDGFPASIVSTCTTTSDTVTVSYVDCTQTKSMSSTCLHTGGICRAPSTSAAAPFSTSTALVGALLGLLVAAGLYE
jgi:hypothetical protein